MQDTCSDEETPGSDEDSDMMEVDGTGIPVRMVEYISLMPLLR
jgi:hypothetical protein